MRHYTSKHALRHTETFQCWGKKSDLKKVKDSTAFLQLAANTETRFQANVLDSFSEAVAVN